VSVSTHVLDAVLGRPAAGVAVQLFAGNDLLATGAAGPHRLVFGTGDWFATQARETFWPEVVLSFAVREPTAHHHVPLLLSPFAYSTYRGS